jgi:hypothetical protein
VTDADGGALQLRRPDCRVEVTHVNYDTLYVAASEAEWPMDDNGDPISLDLMLLLRI